jgi:hypothetical protein
VHTRGDVLKSARHAGTWVGSPPNVNTPTPRRTEVLARPAGADSQGLDLDPIRSAGRALTAY